MEHTMDRWSGRVAIVTGASAGIGFLLAERLVKHGMVVIGCARNIAAIEELSKQLLGEKGKLVAVKCDVSKEADVVAVFTKAREEYKGVDICINNAGLAHSEPLLSGNTEQWRQILEVNVLGVATVTREAVTSMREKGVDDGHVINLNSLSGHRLVPNDNFNFYAASKFAVTAMTEGVRNELRQLKSNIRVSQVSPGLVATDFKRRFSKSTKEEAEEYYKTAAHVEAEDVVDAIVYQLGAPPHVQVHDILMRATIGQY